MSSYIIRQANINDIDLITESIIAAEKSGSDILSYNKIFGLSENETKIYIKKMLQEEIDGCELSISSYLIAQMDGKPSAAMGAWIEGIEGISSSAIKGNLLSYILPDDAIHKAKKISHIISEMNIEYIPDSLSIGIVYIKEKHRGKNLVSILLDKHINQVSERNSKIKVFIQVFGNNIAAIKAYKKLGFIEHEIVHSNNKEVEKFLPSNKKILLKK